MRFEADMERILEDPAVLIPIAAAWAIIGLTALLMHLYDNHRR